MSAVLSAIAAHRTAYATYSVAVSTNVSDSPAVLTTGKAEREAVNALLAAPVASLADASAKTAYIRDEIDMPEDYFGEDDMLRSFLQSFQAPADPLATLIAEFRAFEATIDQMADDEFNAACRKPHPTLERLQKDPPAATAMAGVEAALQLMADEDAKGNDWLRDGFLDRVVLPFFRGQQAVPVAPDPLLAIVQRYRAQLAEFNKITGKTNEEADAMRDATWGPFERGVEDGSIVLPAATSMAGAAAALRCACDEDTTQAVAGKMRDAALAFLEGSAKPSEPSSPDPMLTLVRDSREAKGDWRPGNQVIRCQKCDTRFRGGPGARECASCAYGGAGDEAL